MADQTSDHAEPREPEHVGEVAARVLARFSGQAAPGLPRPPGVFAKLLAAQQAVEGVVRSGRNDHFNYRFVQEHEVLDVCKEALGAAGLAFAYDVLGIKDRVVKTRSGNEELMTDIKLQLRLLDPADGSSVECTFFGRGQDNMDKGINKALVAGVKYGLLKLLMVSTGADDTEDAKNDQRTGGGSAPQTGEVFRCPECGSPMWDNRSDPRSNRQGGKRPPFVCKANKAHVVWGSHPQEKPPEEPQEPQEAGGGGEGAQGAGSNLKGLSKAQLQEAFHNELPYPQHPHAFAYALVDPKVRDDLTRWTKDDYVRALTNAEKRGGVAAMCAAAAGHLAKTAPATTEQLDQLNQAITTAHAAGMPDEDARWLLDCGLTAAGPLVEHALTIAREYEETALQKAGGKKAAAPAKPAAPPQRGPDDDLPF